MKLTLLDYVQNIASAMSSDEVNSISDTVESMQIAEVVKTTFFNIMARANLPEQKKLFQLDSSADIAQPNLMFLPEGIKTIEWLKYYDADTAATQYKYVTLIPLQQFVDYVNGFEPSQTNVETMNLTIDSQTYLFRYRTDIQPCYATVLSDYYVIFDAYNDTIDSTLQSSKTECFGLEEPVWLMEDTFIPQLDAAQVPLLLNEAKSLAFFELKQTNHQKAELEARRQWTSLQRDKSIDNKPSYFDQLPDFGRKGTYWRGSGIKW
jgi:hypothetical protein